MSPWVQVSAVELSPAFCEEAQAGLSTLPTRREVDGKPLTRRACCESAVGKPSVEIIIMVIVEKGGKLISYILGK